MRRIALIVVASLFAFTASAHAAEQRRPNIIWIVVEDMSAHFGCYGETSIRTPHVDALAARGTRFTRAYTTAPVCSTARSAMVTGMYQTTIGAHHHRSGRGVEKIYLPSHVRLVPQLFREAGYYVVNGGKGGGRRNRIAKTDYNFEWDESATYDGGDWSGRREGQPFFAQVQLSGGKLRGKGDGEAWPKRVIETLGSRTKHEQVKLPPYYPNHPVLLEDWAQYLDAVRYTDYEVGQVLKRLEDEGIADETIVFFITDHGISHSRGKQYCYEEGMHIPFIVAGPGIASGTLRDDLIQQIDIAATSLALAGIPVPEYMQGRDLFAKNYEPRKYVVSARDRCDETVERIRGVRAGDFKYIRNGYPQRPHLQPNRYKDGKPIQQVIRQLDAEGKLNAAQKLVTVKTRPVEELYDLRNDPWEIHNLAADPKHKAKLTEMRGMLDEWIKQTGDMGQQPEPEAMYDSDMAAYLGDGKGEGDDLLRANIAQMKKWAAEGK